MFTRVRLLLCDVDGVLTDATALIGNGTEYKQFSIQDGLGIHLLQQEGIRVGWISHRPSEATRQRAKELKIEFLHQKPGGKVPAAESILAATGCDWKQLCYIGDDLVDLAVLRRAGIGVAPANAVPEAKAVADLITTAPGGHGAVREVARLILSAQKKWSRIVREYFRS